MFGQGPFGSVPFGGTAAYPFTPTSTLTATFGGFYGRLPGNGQLVATFTSVGAQGAAVASAATAPKLTAVAVADPLTGAPQISLTVTNTQHRGAAWKVPSAVILRSDGQYVLGASPLAPLAFPTGSTSVTIVDRSAPYGLPVSYVAFTTYLGVTSAPSAPARATMGQAPDTTTLYSRLGWPADQDTTGQLLAWISGIGEMIQAVDNLCAGQSDTDGNVAPPWSQLLDIKRCPTAALPWLGQFNGVRVNPNARDDQQRYAIEHPQGFARGTPAAIVDAANALLQSGYSATLRERDTGPYHLTVEIPAAGVSGAGTCRSLPLEFPTCAALKDAVATCRDIWQDAGAVEDAVLAAVPAGLGVSITYV